MEQTQEEHEKAKLTPSLSRNVDKFFAGQPEFNPVQPGQNPSAPAPGDPIPLEERPEYRAMMQLPANPPVPAAPPAPPAPPAPAAPAAPPATAAQPAPVGKPDYRNSMSQITAPAPAPVAEEPAPGSDPVPEEIGRDNKARNAWTRKNEELSQLKAVVKAREERVATLEREILEKSKPDPRMSEETERLKSQLAEYESKLGRTDLAQSPAFQAKWDNKIQAMRTETMRFVHSRSTGRNMEQVAQLLARVEKAQTVDEMQNLLENEHPSIQGLVMLNMEKVKEMQSQRDAALNDWKNERPAAEEAFRRQQEQERLGQIIGVTDELETELADEKGPNHWILSEKNGDPSWEDRRVKLKASARASLRDNDPREIARLVYLGHLADLYKNWGEGCYNNMVQAQSALERRARFGRSIESPGAAPRGQPSQQPPPPANPQSPGAAGDIMDKAKDRVDQVWNESFRQ